MARAEEVIASWDNDDDEEYRKLRNQLASNQEKNWLFALLGHAFNKAAQGRELSDLENDLVSQLQADWPDNGDGPWTYLGTLSGMMSDRPRQELFSGRFAVLSADDWYTYQDLQNDLPQIEEAILSDSSTLISGDPSEVAGASSLREYFPGDAFAEQSLDERGDLDSPCLDLATEPPSILDPGMGWTGGPTAPSIGVSVAALSGASDTARVESEPARYRIKAPYFKCNIETPGFGQDEAYWLFSSTVGSRSFNSRSRIFGCDGGGRVYALPDIDGCLWPPDCRRDGDRLLDDTFGLHVELFENDDADVGAVLGFLNTVIEKAAAPVLTAAGMPVWAAVLTGVGQTMKVMSSWFDDDQIAHLTYVYTRADIEDRVRQAGSSFFTRFRFADGDADYELAIKMARTT